MLRLPVMMLSWDAGTSRRLLCIGKTPRSWHDDRVPNRCVFVCTQLE